MSLLYRQAAGILRQLQEKKRTLKSLTDETERKQVTLATKCLTFTPILREIIRSVGLDAEELDVDLHMLFVLIYELLFGKGVISGGGAVKRKLQPFLDALHEAKDKCMQGRTDVSELLPEDVRLAQALPVYLRVNTKLVSVSDAVVYLKSILGETADVSIDSHIPYLVSIPSGSGLGADPWVTGGRLVLQDKASCLPAFILEHYHTNGHVIDACAAPGNKTSQLATFIHHLNAGRPTKEQMRVFAFDKSADRAAMLTQRMKDLHVDDVVTVTNGDFLRAEPVGPLPLDRVQSILLDPSCSGSGIVRNALDRIMERVQQEEVDDPRKSGGQQSRVLKLQAFQVKILTYALTTFAANVNTAVYSTCSVHCEENECVVEQVLRNTDISALGWRLEAPECLSRWPRRGLVSPTHHNLTPSETQALVRCLPEDGMNGFFVALFRRDPVEDVTGLVQSICARRLQVRDEARLENMNKKRKREEKAEAAKSEPMSDVKVVVARKEKKAKTAESASSSNGSFFGRQFVSKRMKRKFGKA